MNPTPPENKSIPPRANWFRRFFALSACLLLIAGIIAVGAWFYLRSERFNRYVADQIKAKLPEYGLRGEIGDFGITLDENRARLKDLKVYNLQTGQLIATLKSADISIQIRDLYALKLSREVEIEKVVLDGLDLNVEIDEKGRTNFEGLRLPPPVSKAITFDTRRLLTSVSSGAIHFKDRLRKIEADLTGLEASAQPLSENSEIFKLLSSATAGRFSYEGREVKLATLDLAARVSAKGAEVESLALESGLGEVKAKGRLDDWLALSHAFDVESKIKLDEAARLLAASVAVKGSVVANARIEGQPANEKITGSVRSDEIEAAGAKLHSLQIAGIKVDAKSGQSGWIQFSGDRVTVQSVVVDKVKLGQIAVSNLAGNHKNGRTEVIAPVVTAAGVEAPDTRVAAVRLHDLSVEVTNAGRYEVTADAVAENAQIGDVKVSNVTAKALADNDDLVINDIKGKVFGGEFEADYEMPMARSARSKIKGSFTGIETRDAAALLKAQNLPVAGKVGGTADLSIIGSNPRSLSGEIMARFEGKANETTDAIPLTGDVLVRADNGVFSFERAELATDASQITASGKLSYDSQSDLRVSLRSSQAEQLLLIARSLEAARPFIEEYEPQLIGEFKLDGQITGKLDNLTIEGDINATTIGLRDAILGALTGHVFVSPTEVRVEKGVVTAPNSGTVKFDLASPLDKTAKSGTLSATIDRINLETILAAAGAPNAEQFISGDVSGAAHLTGLPADLEGSAEINLIGGKIADQPAETAVAEVRFDGRDAFLERLEVKLPQSRLTATGSMNLDDYAFKLEGKADQIAFDSLAQALELQNTKIEGSADASFDVSGKVLVAGKAADLDWESLKIQLDAQGKNVKVNGQDTGELKLTAETSPGGRLDAKLTTGILTAQSATGQTGKPETIKASIELRKTGRPVVIESELANLDVTPLLSLFAPELVSTLTGTITGRLRVEGPTTDANGNATLDQLRGGLTLGGTDLQVAGNPMKIETPVSITLDNSRVNAAAINLSGPGVDLKFSGTIGLKAESPINFTLGGSVSLDRLPPVSDDLFISGTVTIDARAAGSVSEPQLAGKVDIAGLNLSSSNRPVFINGGEGAITLSGDQLKLEKFTANANDGTIEASGVTKLERFRPAEWKYTIAVNNAQLIEQEINTTLTGTLTLTGTPAGQLLAGTVVIPQAEYQPDIDFDNIAVGGGGGLALGAFNTGPGISLPSGIAPVNLHVRVEARDSIIIRNKQINTVGTGSLELNGKLSDPDVTGRITLDGGTLRFRGQRYEISNGSLDLPLGGATPVLNLLAEGEYSGYRVSIGLIGPIDDLDMALRSEPQLTRGEILSLIATGRTEASTLGAQDPLRTGVGTAASLLTTGLISRPAERLLGISRFQIDPVLGPNLNPAARLTIGQQLSRNVYLTYSTNLATEQFQTALAEYTISNRFSALASYTQGGNAARQGQREGVVTIELRGRQRFSLGFEPGLTGPAGDPNDALVRIAGPKLPLAQVGTTPVPGLKIKQDKLRELLPVMTQGFSRLLARLGERRLQEYLQEQGYFFAEVTSRCEPVSCTGENLKVFYDIEPNIIYDLKEIRIEGTDLVKLRDIEEFLQSQTRSKLGGSSIFRGLPFIGGYVRGLTSSDRLSDDAEFIRRYLVDIGYRNARVSSRLAVAPNDDDLILIFDVNQGPQFEIAEVTFRGNTILPQAELLKAVPIKPGDAFSFTRTRVGAQQIKQLYTERGFLEADANLEVVDLANDRVQLVYSVNEGVRAFVSEIDITGTTKTGKGWVRRYFDFKQGELLTPEKIRQTQRDLYATNAFREVILRAEPLGGDDGAAHKVSVNLTEAKPLLFVYGLGYSTDVGARGLLELANTNLGGTLNSLSLRLRGSSREQFAQLSFTDLRPFGTKFPTTVSVFYNRNGNLLPFVRRRLVDGKVEDSDNDSFGLNRFAAFIQTERKVNERTSLRLRYNFEQARLFNIEGIPETEVTRNERAVRLGTFSFGITRDTRDSVLNPTRGELVSADHSIAANIFGGNESFNKFFASYQRYRTFDKFTPLLPLLKDSTLAFSARIGLAASFRDADRNDDGIITDSEKRLPISERFFSGGATTLRGFRFETAGPQGILEPRLDRPGELPTLVPLGGDALAVFNFEMRYPLTARLRLVPFYDFGNVFRRINDFSFGGMTNTVGLGLRINTPLGPVGVDYGFLIDPPAFTTASGATLRQPRGAFHIRFGQTF